MIYSVITSVIYIIVMSILISQIPLYENLGPKNKKGEFSKNTMFFLAFVALMLRLIFSVAIRGHGDMEWWLKWSSAIAENGPWNLYVSKSVYVDYPPGYMYVLWLIKTIINIFKISEPMTWLMYKLPAMISDVLLSIYVYKIAEKEINGKIAILVFCALAFNPLLYYDSTIWGQVDSFLILFTVISLYNLYKEKYIMAAMFYVIAVLIKPQALMLGPVYLFTYLKTKDIKLIIKTIIYGVLLVIGVSLLFSPAWTEQGNFLLKLLKSFNPTWLIQRYISTMSSYAYATVNAFNFYGLLNANWHDIGERFLFMTYKAWGSIIILVTMIASGFLVYKIKDRANSIFLSSFFIIAFLFAFGTKMHERYLVPAIVFLLMAYIFSRNKKFLWLFTLLGLANLFNIDYILSSYLKGNNNPAYNVVAPISFVQVLLIVLSVMLIYQVYIKKQADYSKESANDKIKRFEKTDKFFGIRYNRLPNKDIFEEVKMVRWDYMILAAITIIYSAVAFANLGDTKAPQTYYSATDLSDSFVAEFENTETISGFAYYDGIGDVGNHPTLNLEYSVDGVNWQKFSAKPELKSVFKWEISDVDSVEAKYIRGVPNNKWYALFEMGFRNADGELIKIKSISGTNNANYAGMFDEQELVPEVSTYMNGTYFDEIYHPRTAYEFLNLLPYYETTHPPLGKLIMSVGVAIFGMTPFGWRFTGTLFGVFMLPMFYLFLKKMFGKTKYATIGTLLFASDFMHYSLTRMGTIDSYPVFFIIVMYYFMYTFGRRAIYYANEYKEEFFKDKKRKWSLINPFIMSGLAWGLGAASKWIAIYAGAGLLVLFILILFRVYSEFKTEKDKSGFKKFLLNICAYGIGFYILIPFVIYTLSYIPISMVKGYGSALSEMWKNQQYMLSYHSHVTDNHPFKSRWWQWPIIYKPLWAYSNSFADGNRGSITIMGNPLVWWTGIAATLYAIVRGFKERSKLVLFVIISFAFQYLPWVFITRSTFIYHFFASVPFMIMLIVYSIRELEGKYKNFKYITIVYCILCIAAFIMFYPILTGTEVSKQYILDNLRWFNSWIFVG